MACSIDINRTWCKRCGICVTYCPKKVYEADFMGAPVIADMSACIGCMICEHMCPDFAINVEKTAE